MALRRYVVGYDGKFNSDQITNGTGQYLNQLTLEESITLVKKVSCGWSIFKVVEVKNEVCEMEVNLDILKLGLENNKAERKRVESEIKELTEELKR